MLNITSTTGSKGIFGSYFSTLDAKNYAFIDFIRFISIVGITSIHSAPFGLPENVKMESFLKYTDSPHLLLVFLLLLRFSVLSFCLITGFLLGPKLFVYNRLTFFYRRIKHTVPPYIIALLLTVIYIYSVETIKDKPTSFFEVLSFNTFGTAFWYIPSNMLSLLLILFFLKKMPQMIFGAVLFTISLIITIMCVYINPVSHTSPIFFPCFAFYIWLGLTCWKRNWLKNIRQIKLRYLLLVWLLGFLLLYAETYILSIKGYPIILHNLKISNQVYGVVTFVTLVRVSEFIKPLPIINVRKETYGIYLYSTLIGFPVAFLLHRVIGYFESSSALLSITYSLVHFSITFILTVTLVKFLLKYKLLFLSRN